MQTLIFFLLVLFTLPSYAQKKMTAQDYKLLGRDSIIRLITEKIREDVDPAFDPSLYGMIKVSMRNNQIYAYFHMPIRFIPKSGTYFYDITVTLPGYSMNYVLESASGKTNMNKATFFIPDEKSRQAVRFIFKSINAGKTDRLVTEETWGLGSVMTIRDKGSHYAIEVDDSNTRSDYKIKKGTGKIYDANHKHYAEPYFREGEKEEILRSNE